MPVPQAPPIAKRGIRSSLELRENPTPKDSAVTKVRVDSTKFRWLTLDGYRLRRLCAHGFSAILASDSSFWNFKLSSGISAVEFALPGLMKDHFQ